MKSLNLKAWLQPVLTCLLLAGLAGVFVWNNLQWIKQSYSFWLFSSSPAHLYASYSLERLFLSSGFWGFIGKLWVPWCYPPLVYLISLPFYLMGKPVFDTAVLSQGIFVLILAFSIWGAARRLFNAPVAWLTVFIVLSLPGIQLMGKYYMLDLPLTAMVSLTFYFYLSSEHFENLPYSLLFALAFGLGLLTRYQMAFYLAGLFLYEIVWQLGKTGRKWLVTAYFGLLLLNLGLNLLGIKHSAPMLWLLLLNLASLALLLALSRRTLLADQPCFTHLTLAYFLLLFPASAFLHLSWPQISWMWQHDFHYQQQGIFPGILKPHFFWIYFSFLPGRFSLGLWMFILFLPAFLWAFFPASAPRKTRLIALIIVAGYFFLAAAPVIHPRFFLPLLPFCALLIVNLVFSLKDHWLKAGLVIYILLFGFWQWTGWRFTQPPFPSPVKYRFTDYLEPIYIGRDICSEFQPVYHAGCLPPCRENWQIEPLVDDLAGCRPASENLKAGFKLCLPPGGQNLLNCDPINSIIQLKGARISIEPYSPAVKDYACLVVVSAKPVILPGYRRIKTYPLPYGALMELFKKL